MPFFKTRKRSTLLWMLAEYAMMAMKTGTYYIHRERQPLQIFLWPSLFSSFSVFFTWFFIIFIQFIQPKIVPVLMMEVSPFLYDFPRLCCFYCNHRANWHNSKSPFALVFVVSPYQCLFEHVLPFITSSIATWTTPDILNWYFAFGTNTEHCSITSIHDSFSFSLQCR